MRRPILSTQTYVEGILSGNRVLLGQAITLVESARPEHQSRAREVIAKLLLEAPPSQPSMRVAITGAPGAGKSTFIEALGNMLTGQGKKVAVLAIDPSSALTKGSILGDKTRMERLSTSELAFIRPSPAGDELGGVARKTRETILLVEAAGYDTVLVETVGVGQSEMAAKTMTDLFLLLLLPGAGDELQGIKRGIVEMADVLVVNKADGDRIKTANQARAHYLNAVHLLPARSDGWSPRVLTCSAETGTGITEVWETIGAFREQALQNSSFLENRKQQATFWLQEALKQGLEHWFQNQAEAQAVLKTVEADVLAGRMSPFAAAETVLKKLE